MLSKQYSKYSNSESNINYSLKCYRNDTICKKGEDIDFFGILVHGKLFAALDYTTKIKDL